MAMLAARLFDFCPPQDVANDSRVFLTGVVELFLAYPRDIVRRAVNVVDGLPSKHKWAPRIAEIKEHLEELMAPTRREEERLARERSYQASLEPPVDRSQRLSAKELKAKYGDWTKQLGPRPTEKPDPFSMREIDASETTVSPYLRDRIEDEAANG
jgi:hypothetical protein